MAKTVKDELLNYVLAIQSRTNQTIATERRNSNLSLVDSTHYFACRAECLNLIRVLGKAGEAWNAEFSDKPYTSSAKAMLGTLMGIEFAIRNNLLVRVEDLVHADTFDSLLEQAEHLLSQNYLIAAGTIGRAVLEQHLRTWTMRAGCVPAKQRPTLNDFTGELYGKQHITKLEMKQIEALAAIGNEAAHGQPVKAEDVERMLRHVREFLQQHP
jgi:hypothetical protein